MTQFTQDKWLNFTIDNFDEIKSLIEVYEYAQKILPERVTSTIIDCIYELKTSYMKDNKLSITKEDGELLWSGSIEKDNGLSFCFESDADWSELTPSHIIESSWIYLWIEPNGKNQSEKKDQVFKITNLLSQHENELNKKGIVLEPNSSSYKPHEAQVLAAYYLFDEVNINMLKMPDNFKKAVQKAAIMFTDEMLSILRS